MRKACQSVRVALVTKVCKAFLNMRHAVSCISAVLVTLSSSCIATSAEVYFRRHSKKKFTQMRLYILVLLLCAVFALVLSDSTEEVLVLTEDNFEEELALHDAVLVKFYAPWCQHSQNLAPEWIKAAEQLASSPVRIAEVDGSENEDLARRYEIGVYPTIKYFRGGRVTDYKSGRTASEIVTWALRKFQAKTHILHTEDDLTAFQEKHELFSLGVFDSEDSAAAKGYQLLADDDEAYVYALTTDAAIKAKLFFPRKVVDKEYVVVFKPFDDMRADLPLIAGKLDLDKVSDFIKYQSTPPVQEFSAATMRRIAQSPIKHHVLFFTDKSVAHHASAMEIYGEVSVDFRNKMLFVNVPSTEVKVLTYFNITPASLPAMVTADFSDKSAGMKQFPYSGALSVREISVFLQSVLDGKQAAAADTTPASGAAAKGEAVSPEDTKGPVVVVRSASYEEIVLRSDKHVLLEFYAPWCGHCKQLAPVWEELGRRLQSRTDVVIAKIDYTANEVQVAGASITGFPTVLLFRRGRKDKPVVYSGSRVLLAFAEFIDANTIPENSIRQEL